jgi:HD superfamily phosphohydrolase
MEKYLHEIDARTRIRDPLYGFISLTKRELQVVDTPLFQRLRRIHQLALTKYVYPSAEHSRFVHSLGVMHCATLIMAGLFDHKLTNWPYHPQINLIKTLRYAALLHDIGHLPFSHAVEKDWLHGLSHEDLSMFIIESYEPIKNILIEDRINPKEVASLLGKKPTAKWKIYHEIISGQLDADRADYLLRDSHCCGVKYGEYDFPRFLQIFAARENENGTLSLCLDEKDLPVAESLLVARYHYNLQIPYHRTRSGFDFALKTFAQFHTNFDPVFTIEDEKIKEVDFDELALLDDGSIMQIIKDKYRQGDYWAKCLMREQHLTPILDTSSMSEEGIRKFKAAVRALKATAALEEGKDFFVQIREVEMIKHASSKIRSEKDDDQGDQGNILLISREVDGTEKKLVDINIRERSWIFGQLDKEPYTIYRIYCKQEKKQKCFSIVNNLPNDGA